MGNMGVGKKKLLLLFVFALVFIVSLMVVVSAEPDIASLPTSNPFKILWDKIVELSNRVTSLFNNLQTQINNLQLTPGPQGPAGEKGPKGDKGEKGDTGLSAYEIWLGLVGTGHSQADFIASLKGETGPQGPEGTCSCSVTTEMYNSLLARIEALENKSACVPLTEICDGKDNDCDGLTDEGGVCITTCTTDSECASGYYCNAGSCVVKKANGAACTGANQCVSGYCADNYCCNSACSGACDTCSQALGATANGACTLLAAGNSGNPSCSPYVCDGLSGSCPTNCQTEVCNGLDDDCDGSVDEGGVCG
jgi:hypothetical protein